MSLRIASTEWISGSLLIGDTGLGVLGSDIPSTGDNGGSYLYNDLVLPADADKEICGRITTWPTAGTLVAYEDGSFDFTGAADGSYSFEYQLYVDGVATGAPVAAVLDVGAVGAHEVTIANSTQANTSTSASIQQAHLIGIVDSVQANVASPGAATQAVEALITIADSVQTNAGTAGSVTQAIAGSVNITDSTQINTGTVGAIQQTHLIGIANSTQTNRCSSGSWGTVVTTVFSTTAALYGFDASEVVYSFDASIDSNQF